jgi:DNA polymerase-4
MSQPSAVSECLWQEVSPLLDRALSECCSPVRLLGMGVSQLRRPGKVQRGLFDVEENERNKQLDQTLDSIRDRLGKAAVKRASSVEHSIRFLNGPMINPEDQT